MSPSGPYTARAPRLWLIAALISAGCLAATSGWCSPARGGRLPAVTAAAAGNSLSTFVDPAWRRLRQLWLGLPWPISGSGGPGLVSRSHAGPGSSLHHGRIVAPRSGRTAGNGNGSCDGEDCEDEDPGHGGDPDG
jgi:hypothetical protein